jgi:para-nitrobenzyl esterase
MSMKNIGNDDLLPVMFYIHGGNFNFGSGSDKIFDGANLAGNEDIVVITIN